MITSYIKCNTIFNAIQGTVFSLAVIDRVVAAFQSFESVQLISALLSSIIFAFFASVSIFAFVKALSVANREVDRYNSSEILEVTDLLHKTNKINFYGSFGGWIGIFALYKAAGGKFGIVGTGVLITLLMFTGMIFFSFEFFYCCQLCRHKSVNEALALLGIESIGGRDENDDFF